MLDENASEGISTEGEEAIQGSETEQELKEAPFRQLPVDMYYDYEELVSKAAISPESGILHNLLCLSHSFGYDCKRRSNLQLLDEQTLAYIAGNILVLQNIVSKKQTYLRSFSGQGIGTITAHPNKEYFAVGEKGKHPNIIIYEYPSLRPYRILRGGTAQTYCYLDFSSDGRLLASVGAPDYMLMLWDWRHEEVKLSIKAVVQDFYKLRPPPHNPGLLMSSASRHIKLWSTFISLKLLGPMRHFGKTSATDMESYVILPNKKVVSGSDWGNLLLWDGNAIKVEICRKEGRTCHIGTVLPFALEEGQLMTIGSDGAVRGWDFESINAADSQGESSKFEMEPMNELVIGHNVCLTSMVKSSLPESYIWFAQDAMGAIWKLDLSFTHTTPDPECLFLFHCGAIQGMDVSKKSHLMATTALDRSVKLFDFVSKQQLTSSRFTQGGTALCWAPPLVNQGGGLLVVGFEDGVVRILDVYDPQKLQTVTGRSRKGDAELRLRQAFKPHSTQVTAVAYKQNAEILATASSDCTVFFFSAGEKYSPIGFINVPGPVQALEWSPHSDSENRLLVLCQSGHVIEVQSPDPDTSDQSQSFQLSSAKTRIFRFKSIKSQIKREEEIARRQALKEKKQKEQKEQKERRKQSKNPELEPELEDEEELPRIFLPNPPSPLYCGFYSQPGRFWLSMGGYDSGFLYHCEFSEKQEVDPAQRQDEPFKALPVHNTDNDPIRSVTFSSDQRLLLCGMNSGSIRVYPLQPRDLSLESMQHCWTLSVHDNNYGPLRHLRCSHDDRFVLTAGDDGNIFSFSLFPSEELPQTTKRAKVPSPQVGLENEEIAQDIEDPSAYSIEMAKQKFESDCLRREAELKIWTKRKILDDLQKRFKQLLDDNQSLPEHMQLQPEELQLDRLFSEQTELLKSQKMREVRKQLSWEEERSHLALSKLHNWFNDSLDSNVVTVVALCSDHRVSTYCVPTLLEKSQNLWRQSQSSTTSSTNAALRKIRSEAVKDTSVIKEEEVFRAPSLVSQPARVKLADRQIERLRKAAEKAEKARSKIEKRKEEWTQLYAEKPDENWEDPQDVQAILKAQETIGDLKLKSAKDFTVPKHLRMNAEQKRKELTALEERIRERQTEINARIIALCDSKVELVAHLRAQIQQLHIIQQRLPVEHHRPCPTCPCIRPEEIPEKKRLCYNRTTLLKYKELRDRWPQVAEQDQDRDGSLGLLQQLEKELEVNSKGEEEEQNTRSQSEAASESGTQSETEMEAEGLVEKTELEEEVQMEERVRLLHKQDSILEQMENAVCEFDAELVMLRHQKLHLDCELKLDNLKQLMLYQELLLLKDFERREDSLQEKLNIEASVENCITSKLGKLKEQLEAKDRDITKLHEREKALTAAFLTSLGENNKFEEFLTKVFKKKIKRVKKKEKPAEEEEQGEESDEDSDEDHDWEDDDIDEVDEGGAPLDDSICPQNCDSALFENTLQLRERRLDLEEQLLEEKKSAEALKKDCDTLAKKEKMVKSSRKAVEDDLELVHREKQQKMNELDVVVPLRLHQIEILAHAPVASDLKAVLVLDQKELSRLQQQIQGLHQEKSQQKELFRQAQQQHARLLLENRNMEATIQVRKKQCNDMMMMKFGRLVDLRALQTLSGNRVLEELKHEKLLKEAVYAKEIHQWDLKVLEAREALMNATKSNTGQMVKINRLFKQKKELEHKINVRQKKMGKQFEDSRRHGYQEDIRQLQELVKAQSQQAEALRSEIELLSRKGGHILPPGPAPTPHFH